MRLPVRLTVFSLTAFSLSAQVAQLRWDVQLDRAVSHDTYVWQGETVDLMPRMVQGTDPASFTNAPVEFRYREAALATNLYRSVAASCNTNTGVLSVRWVPDYDVGAAWYDYQFIVGSNAANPRAFGRITMRPTIGWPASTNAPAPVALTNAQPLSLSDWRSGSNALASAVHDARDLAAFAYSPTNQPPALTNYLFGAVYTNGAWWAVRIAPTP